MRCKFRFGSVAVPGINPAHLEVEQMNACTATDAVLIRQLTDQLLRSRTHAEHVQFAKELFAELREVAHCEVLEAIAKSLGRYWTEQEDRAQKPHGF